jgi:sterol desaturase/sphingolipid hydroxylase (fatty acid hydroxylase superfamily)
MTIAFAILSTAASFFILVLIFAPLEKCFPAKTRQKFLRPEWWTDLAFFLGQYLLWTGLVFGTIAAFGNWLGAIIPGSFRAGVAAQPFWLQVLELIVLSDLSIYWAHRLQHRVPFLWRFHAVHHSAEHLDWLAAHREHPLDTIYTVTIINLPAFMLGFQLEMLAGFFAFRGIWAIYIHSNVKLPLRPLRMLIGAPELHHWHHHRDRDAGNYANLSPLMDILFGTYRHPGREPDAFGIKEPISRSYLGQMIHPLLPSAVQKRRLAREPEEADSGDRPG